METPLLKFEPESILKDGSRLAIELTERKSCLAKKNIRAKASSSFDDCQRLISSSPGGPKG